MLHSQSSLCEAGDQSPSLHSTQIQLNILNHIYYINILTFPGCFYVLCKYNSFQFSEYLLLSNNNTLTGRVDNRLIFQISLIFISYISLSTFIHLSFTCNMLLNISNQYNQDFIIYVPNIYYRVINDTLSKVLSIIYIFSYITLRFYYIFYFMTKLSASLKSA